ncbi:MAG: F0F1 ATP synthase subunit epsilon [Alphaproteobacteria bacterium]
MNLKVITPYSVALNTPVSQVTLEAVDGFFTLKPKHIDFINVLKPGILAYKKEGEQAFIACNRGVIVKKGEEVSISTPLAILGKNLEELKKKIAVEFQMMEQERKEVRVSMARLEMGLTKGLASLSVIGGSDGGI